MFTFLSPLFLIGLLSAAIPLVIHLSRSRRTKTLRFSTTRFFTDQFLRSYRMSKLKEWLLLACRMALCALLATALARPLLMPKGPSVLAGSRSVVLVIDNSASMGVAEGGVTPLDRARGIARELVEGLGPGDTASVVLAGRREAGPDVLFPEPTSERGDILQAIDTLQVAALGTDLTGAVGRAGTIARSSRSPSKEVYVLSDLQNSGWELPDAAASAREGSDVLVFVVPLHARADGNLAVTAVQYGAARPMVGVPFAIRPHLAIAGGHPASGDVRLFIDGRKVSERPLETSRNGRWAVPTFHHTFTAGGWHSGYVEVEDRTLLLDDRRHFALEVLDSTQVLAVDGAPSQVPRLDELFFLKTALNANAEGKSPIRIDPASPADLAQADLSKFPIVILANVGSIPAPAVERLESFVDRGGSLLIFLGDRTDPAFSNANLAAPTRLHGGLLPGRLLRLEGDPASPANIATIGRVDDDHVALDAFQDPRFASLAGVGFKALWGIDPGPSTAVLMRTETGSPLLCEKPFGKGRVILFASTCDRDWTNFPVRPAFLPWLHRLVGYLAQQPLDRRGFYTTGDRVPLPFSASEGLAQVSVKKPDGTIGHPTMGDDPDHPLVFTDTAQPGIYGLSTPGKPGPLFAVNLESGESDMRALDELIAPAGADPTAPARVAKVEGGLRPFLPGQPSLVYVADPARVAEASLSARRGMPLWDLALWVVLALALVEPWLANRISMRHYARPREVSPTEAPRTGRLGRFAPSPARETDPSEVAVP